MSTILDSHREDASRRDWQHILHVDALLVVSLIALSTLGLFVLYSSAGGDDQLVLRQCIRLGIAFGAAFIVAQLRTQWLERWTPWLYGVGLLLLVAVLAFGDVGKGAQRWLDLGFVRFQPSEMMKLAVPMMVAWYLSDKRLPPSPARLSIAGALIVVPVLLIASVPEMSRSPVRASSSFAPEMVRMKMAGCGSPLSKTMVSAPAPAGHSLKALSVLAAITASRSEHSPSLAMTSLVVVTVIVASARAGVTINNTPNKKRRATIQDRSR